MVIGSPDLKANHNISQNFEFIADHEKYHKLTRLLEREMDGNKILIFCETKRGCDAVSALVARLARECQPLGLLLVITLHLCKPYVVVLSAHVQYLLTSPVGMCDLCVTHLL